MQQMWNAGRIILLGALAISAYRDWKEKQVYLYVPLLSGIAGIVLHILYQEHSLPDMLGGVAVGAAVLLIAWIGRECVGIGDGIMLMVTGIFLGFWENLALFFTALLLAGGVALFLLAAKRKERSYRLPFLPFLLAAYLVQLL